MITQILAAALLAGPAKANADCTAIGPHPVAALSYICTSEAGWAESVASGDATIVKQILADDFIGVHPSGRHYRKAEMVDGTPKAPETFATNHVNDVIVRFYGNVAIAQGNETWRKKNGDTGRFVWTDTWLKRNGKWQIVAAEDLTAPVKVAK